MRSCSPASLVLLTGYEAHKHLSHEHLPTTIVLLVLTHQMMYDECLLLLMRKSEDRTTWPLVPQQFDLTTSSPTARNPNCTYCNVQLEMKESLLYGSKRLLV